MLVTFLVKLNKKKNKQDNIFGLMIDMLKTIQMKAYHLQVLKV